MEKDPGRKMQLYLANAAMALYCTGAYSDYEIAYAAAVESLESRKAADSLNKLISLQ